MSSRRPSRLPLPETRRKLHTLKGNAGIYGMQRLASLCHGIETGMADSGGDMTRAHSDALAATWSQTAQRLSTFLGEPDAGVVIDDDEYAQVLRLLLDGTPRADMVRSVRDWKQERVTDRLERFATQARELSNRLGKGDLAVEVVADGLRLPTADWTPFWAAFTACAPQRGRPRNRAGRGPEGRGQARSAVGSAWPHPARGGRPPHRGLGRRQRGSTGTASPRRRGRRASPRLDRKISWPRSSPKGSRRATRPRR